MAVPKWEHFTARWRVPDEMSFLKSTDNTQLKAQFRQAAKQVCFLGFELNIQHFPCLLSQVIWAAQSAKLQKHFLGLSYQAVCNGAVLEENTSVIVLMAVPIQLVICDGEIRFLTELLLPCQQMKSKWKHPNYQQRPESWIMNPESSLSVTKRFLLCRRTQLDSFHLSSFSPFHIISWHCSMK